jgi:hypothetical protein
VNARVKSLIGAKQSAALLENIKGLRNAGPALKSVLLHEQ